MLVLAVVAAQLEAQGPGRGRGRGGGFGFRRMGNDLVVLVGMTEVQEELAIDKEQEQLLDALTADLFDQQRVAFRGGFGPSDGSEGAADGAGRALKLQQLRDTGEKLILSVMDPDQASRLAELRVQFEGLRAFDRDSFVAALKLTELQKEQIREIREARRPLAEIEREVMMSLTEDQIAKWDELKGESFTFPRRRPRFGRRGFRGPPRDDSDD